MDISITEEINKAVRIFFSPTPPHQIRQINSFPQVSAILSQTTLINPPSRVPNSPFLLSTPSTNSALHTSPLTLNKLRPGPTQTFSASAHLVGDFSGLYFLADSGVGPEGLLGAGRGEHYKLMKYFLFGSIFFEFSKGEVFATVRICLGSFFLKKKFSRSCLG